MEQSANLLPVLKTILKYKWTIFILCAVTFVGTAGISLLLPNYYKATTIFFAASEDLAKPESLFSERGSNIQTEYYGNEDDRDRLLTVAQSNELKDFLIDSFQLYAHYKMNPEAPKAKYRMRKKVNKYYDIIQTDRDAIKLSYEDKDPEFAARIANAAREKIQNITLRLVRSNQIKSLRANESNLGTKTQNLEVISDSLASLQGKYGIYNGAEQVQGLAERISTMEGRLTNRQTQLGILKQSSSVPRDTITFLNAQVKGLSTTLDTLKTRLDLWRQGLGKITALEQQHEDLARRLAQDRERTRVLQATYLADVPVVLVVETAEVPLYKSRPSRSILVLAATFIMFCFSVLGVLFFEYYKEVDWKSVLDA
ncbi:MAG TPA: hypothetical protein VJ953_17345 [Saprospiraceae bacterium]|nr:hypothetical protein [Saprospiraceae bacterium]